MFADAWLPHSLPARQGRESVVLFRGRTSPDSTSGGTQGGSKETKLWEHRVLTLTANALGAGVDQPRVNAGRKCSTAQPAIATSIAAATSIRRRNTRSGAISANHAKPPIHSGELSICMIPRRANSASPGEAGPLRVATVVTTATSPTPANVTTSVENADQKRRDPRRNHNARPVGARARNANMPSPYIVSPPAIMPPMAWLSAGV